MDYALELRALSALKTRMDNDNWPEHLKHILDRQIESTTLLAAKEQRFPVVEVYRNKRGADIVDYMILRPSVPLYKVAERFGIAPQTAKKQIHDFFFNRHSD